MKLLSLFTFAILCTSSAFAGDKSKDIIGKWVDDETGSVVEYKERGNLEQTLPSGDVMRGKYCFPDEDHITITLESELIPIATVTTPITIDGDDMEVIGPDGKKPKKLKRQKEAKSEN